MRIYLRLLVAFLLLSAGNVVYAEAQQEKRVTGTVTSEGEPLPGVSVQVKGASSGTITDIDGNYSIEAPANGTIVFRFVGLRTVEQAVNNRNVINVTMESESKELEEVMVVAYATAKKYSFTGAASTMKAGEIEKLQTSSVSRVLEGTVSGVQASASSGQPGTDAEIRIRGIGSINASSAPLYVVDGVPFDGSVNSINPDDIASMTVLKDAASAALYGSRGANGVIIITTKQGQQDSKATVKVKATLGGSSRAVRDYDRVNTNQYFELYWEALRNQYAKSSDYTPATAAAQASKDLVTKLMGGGPNPYGTQYPQPVGTDGKLAAGARPLWNSDWSDAMEQQALRTELNLSVSGGGRANQYFFSAGYLNDKGIALESGYQRFNLRSNVTSEMTSWLKGSINLSFAHSMQNYPVSSDSKTSNVITAGRTMPGFYPIYEMNTDGSYKLDDNGDRIYDFGSYRPSGSMANWNLPATLPLDKSERMKDEFSGRTYLEATIIEGLKFKTSFNFDLINYNTLDYTNPKIGPALENGGGSSRLNSRTFSWTWNNIASYDKTIGDHHFNVLAGMEAYSYRYDELTASRTKMAQPDMPELVVGSQLTGGSGYRIDYALVGYLTQALYDYQNKYFFSASFRRDGSSRMPKANRYANFPSFSAAWVLTNESFMQNVEPLTSFKLRGSWGKLGNQEIGNYSYAPTMAAKYNYYFGNQKVIGMADNIVANDKIKWETTTITDVGFDASFWKGRISITFDWYNKLTSDILLKLAMPYTYIGFLDAPLQNAGKVQNRGWELSANYFDHKGDFSWNVGFNLSSVRNKIVDDSGGIDQKWETTINREGYPIGAYYGLKAIGIYRTEADLNRTNSKGEVIKQDGTMPALGDIMYEDTDDSGNVTSDDRVIIGNPFPKMSYSFNLGFSWKGIDVSTFWQGVAGIYRYNWSQATISNGGNMTTEWLDRWSEGNPNGSMPRLGNTENEVYSSFWLKKSDYLRLKNMEIGYTFPAHWLKGIGVQNVRFYVAGTNLLTFTPLKNYDPEKSSGDMRNDVHPNTRTYSFVVNVKF